MPAHYRLLHLLILPTPARPAGVPAAAADVQTCMAHAVRMRGGVPWKGSFWSDGSQAKVDGYLFNETPPPPGQSRRLESWEIP